eukprot:s818_g27.t1
MQQSSCQDLCKLECIDVYCAWSEIPLETGHAANLLQHWLQRTGHFAYTVHSTEDMEILKQRIDWAGNWTETNVIVSWHAMERKPDGPWFAHGLTVLSGMDLEREALRLAEQCEPFHYRASRGQEFLVSEDPASSGLSYIMQEANSMESNMAGPRGTVRRRGILVYLSGTGADEIISDYGHAGKKIFPHSNFGGAVDLDISDASRAPHNKVHAEDSGSLGLFQAKQEIHGGLNHLRKDFKFWDLGGHFPEDLGDLFPWEAFFLGTQRDYLMKEELVAGVHGVEARYPFLDRMVVQEFLWLSPSVKNAKYKAPVHDWLERFEYPFRSGAAWHGNGTEMGEREEALDRKELALAKREADLTAAEAQLAQEALRLQQQWQQIREQVQQLNLQLQSQSEAQLRFATLRLLPLQQAATRPFDAWKSPLAARESGEGDPIFAFDARHPHWSGVEVITCVSGGRYVTVMDFPVFHLLRASTPLPVHNVCENHEWDGMYMRLRFYRDFLEKHLAETEGVQKPRLFIISDGMDAIICFRSEYLFIEDIDVIFNDLQQIIQLDPALKGLHPAEAVSRVIIERYEAIIAGSHLEVVFSSERLCGWGGGHVCSDEDDSRYPQAPTDSKYLNAGGYIGPAPALLRILQWVLAKATAVREGKTGSDPLRWKTTAQDAIAGETDQYFFKMYFWEHPESVTLDYHQYIFGNFVEVEGAVCRDGWRPRCSMQPCCTVSDSFRRFQEIFYGNYRIET